MWNRNSIGKWVCVKTGEEVTIIKIDHAEEPDTKMNWHVELYNPYADYREYIKDTRSFEVGLKYANMFIKNNPNGSTTIDK